MNRIAPTLLVALTACAMDDLGGGPHEETEVITTVTLTFTPAGGTMSIQASFRDIDGDGGVSGMTDPIALVAGTTYAMTVEFLDELASPVEEITAEIEEEAEVHQVFVIGTAVAGPAASDTPGAVVEHAYADSESTYGANTGDDLPVGLANMMTTRTAGSGDLTIVLRHMPELNGQPQKLMGLAASLADGDALPGEVDANVTFDLTVQ